MIQRIYKPMLWLLLASLVFYGFTTVKKEFKKTIKKEFDLSRNGELEIDNKFGRVEIKTWDKSEVSIEVTLVVRADSEKEAQGIFDRISIHFSNDRDYVKAETEIASKKSSSWWGWGSSNNNNNDYDINYAIYMPATAELDLSNKHGEAVIDKLKGDASIDIAHGELSAQGFDGDLDLDFAHSDGIIGDIKVLTADIKHSDIRFANIEEAELDLAHSDVEIDNIEILRLDSRHTHIELGEVGELRADTRHDDFEIESVKTLISETQHTTFAIDHLEKLADLDCAHGRISIDKVEAGFQSINLYGTHTTFRIEVAEDADYQLDANGSHANIRYPSEMDIRYEKDKENSQEIQGHYGNANSKGASMIKARLSHGSLQIRN